MGGKGNNVGSLLSANQNQDVMATAGSGAISLVMKEGGRQNNDVVTG